VEELRGGDIVEREREERKREREATNRQFL
jgi:hypothetical protein